MNEVYGFPNIRKKTKLTPSDSRGGPVPHNAIQAIQTAPLRKICTVHRLRCTQLLLSSIARKPQYMPTGMSSTHQSEQLQI